MASSAPIGVFDSGLGGISVARQLRTALPHERIIYFGDSANAPYGVKTPEEVKKLSFAIVENFVRLNVKAIVIACNTATSASVNDLREHYSIPIVGMEPALKLACDLGKGKPQRVIVAATELTLRERKFADLLQRFSKDNTIFPQACPDLVRIVEDGNLDNRDVVFAALHKYFDKYDLESIDSVVLGCTHFVFYRDYFREFLPARTNIVDGNEGTINHLRKILEDLGELASESQEGSITLTNSNTSERMQNLAESLCK